MEETKREASRQLYLGQVLKWSTRTDCKSVASRFEGSNPSLPIFLRPYAFVSASEGTSFFGEEEFLRSSTRKRLSVAEYVHLFCYARE